MTNEALRGHLGDDMLDGLRRASLDMTPSELLDRPVSEVLALLPAAGRVFLDRGMSCPGCPFSPFETVADVAVVYGADAITLAAALLDAADVTASGAPQ